MIHETAVVEESYLQKFHERENIEILQHTVVREPVYIGRGTRVCSHCYIDSNVVIGRKCKIKNGALIYNGVVIGNNVFIGPGVTFTNDPFPRANLKHGEPYPQTTVDHGASIGANSTILPGVTIGERAMIGAGSVVTKDVEPYTTVVGSPAEVMQ